MKKFFMTLPVIVAIIFFANVTHAAKFQTLANITADEFFSNMGYEVDCTHWQRARDGRRVFATMIPEEPLIISKDYANVEVLAEKKNSMVTEVVLYFQTKSDTNSVAAIVAKALKSLDAEFFQANQPALEQSIGELLSTPNPKVTVAVDYLLSKEEADKKTFIVRIKPAKSDL